MSVAIHLGVNIDHVATLRQARRARYPDPVHAALAAEQAGADSITLHLREDRRHIQDHDVLALRGLLQTRMNLELAVTDEMLAIAAAVRPADCCLVPERRLEITTEGGLDVAGQATRVGEAAARLTASGVRVALFIDPDERQIEIAKVLGAKAVEIQTARYSEARSPAERERELDLLEKATDLARQRGLHVHMGHGLNYVNVQAVARIPGVEELNIGHSIVSRAVLVGMERAVREMKEAMRNARF